MKCKICKGEVYITIKYPKMALCKEHFIEYFEKRVKKTIKKYEMIKPEDKVLIAISGGKDGAVVTYVLKKLGYNVECLHINLGIGEFSKKSLECVKKQTSYIGVRCHIVDLKELTGKGIPEVKSRKPKCSICGTAKRYIVSKFACDNGFNVIVTGHNLDDEASFILNNVMNWSTGYLARQGPILPQKGKLPKKVKPLYELTEEEISSYAEVVGLEVFSEKCPFAKKAITLEYKEMLNKIEETRPGTKYRFVIGYLKNRHLFEKEIEDIPLMECKICGMPSSGEVCSFCRTWELKEEIDLKVKG
ncbi:tRNA-5-methyluridine(54) 2-sulfurtransferase [Methanotorris formicicus]|uniref:Uncharacterized protein n=1 Tax=Methanotorris formicicus Mc-S-70 TaxID=647171 RepID=H1KXD1_9EURY|nr:TIGR00269 family protein [Methanotorris formicicus]EHP88343.1 hypothetical protein MetfoDRAFT_0454 [Methanotorris formicicus Mc-S-70]